MAKGIMRKFLSITGVFLVALLIEQAAVGTFGLQTTFASNPIFAFFGPAIIAAIAYFGIEMAFEKRLK